MSNSPALPSINLTSALARPRGKRKTVLKVKCFKEDPLIGSKGDLVSWCKTSERFQEIPSWVCLYGGYPGDERDFVLADVEG